MKKRYQPLLLDLIYLLTLSWHILTPQNQSLQITPWIHQLLLMIFRFLDFLNIFVTLLFTIIWDWLLKFNQDSIQDNLLSDFKKKQKFVLHWLVTYRYKQCKQYIKIHSRIQRKYNNNHFHYLWYEYINYWYLNRYIFVTLSYTII